MNDTEQLDAYLNNRLQPGEKLLMDARFLIDAELRDKANWQRKAYLLIQQYGRKELRTEIAAIQERMFSDDKFIRFRNKIKKIFN